MDSREFQELKTLEKVQYVLGKGEEVMSRIYMYYHIKLYSVDSFFVEIWYRQSASKIDYVEVVDIDDVFLNYKKEIDISDLYQKN
jgi:hypothetical protein